MLRDINQIILKCIIIGFAFILFLVPSSVIAGGAECDYINKHGSPYPWKWEWVTCPKNQTCVWAAYPRECRHQPPWEGEKCTIFSGDWSGDEDGDRDFWNFCKDDDNYCKGFDDGLAGTCTPYGKVGEECNGVQTLCANILGNTGRMCRPSYYNLDGSPTGMECYPNWRTFDISTEMDCWNAYSRETHEKVINNFVENGGNSILPMTVSYSSGYGGSVVYGVTEEVGVVYSGDGVYACFTSSCQGFGSSVGGELFISQGVYDNSYDDFIRGNILTDFSVDAALAGVSYAAVGDGVEKVGDVVTFWAGIAKPGVGFDAIYCNTAILYEYTWDPIGEVLVSSEPPPLECKNTSVCADAETCMGDVSISSRPGLEPVFVRQEPLGPYEIGSYEITLKAISDEEIASCSAIGEVIDCTPPELNCPSIIEECTSSEGAYINPPNPTYTDCTEVELDLPDAGTYPLGETEVLYYATDIDNNQSACQAIVNVVDTTGPLFESIVAEPNMLWPPNHKMRRVELDVTASDTCGSEVQCKVIDIAINPQAEGSGGGNTSDDTQILDNQTVLLRAERSGKNQGGRVYSIFVECTDAAGNSTVDTVNVISPHDSKN